MCLLSCTLFRLIFLEEASSKWNQTGKDDPWEGQIQIYIVEVDPGLRKGPGWRKLSKSCKTFSKEPGIEMPESPLKFGQKYSEFQNFLYIVYSSHFQIFFRSMFFSNPHDLNTDLTLYHSALLSLSTSTEE